MSGGDGTEVRRATGRSGETWHCRAKLREIGEDAPFDQSWSEVRLPQWHQRDASPVRRALFSYGLPPVGGKDGESLDDSIGS